MVLQSASSSFLGADRLPSRVTTAATSRRARRAKPAKAGACSRSTLAIVTVAVFVAAFCMGGANSSLADSEDDLFQSGLRWYATWRRAQGEREYNPPTINASDVLIGNGMHIHTVECVSTASHSVDAVPLVAMHGFGTGVGICACAGSNRQHGRQRASSR